jgi:hypothetical protein
MPTLTAETAAATPETAAATPETAAATPETAAATAETAAATATTAPITPGIISITAENLPEKSSALAATLVGEPRLREPSLREGAAAIKWARIVNREAVLAQGRGLVAEAACKHCAGGHGPFNECVVLPGRLGGSCANCHYNSSGARCSFRRKCKTVKQISS